MIDAPTSKAPLRTAALARRDSLTSPERAAASAAIARSVETILAGLPHRSLGVYRAYASEVDTAAIIAAAEARGCEVALPAMVDAEAMRFRRHRTGDVLRPDALAIMAPLEEAPFVEPDVLIVPVTAFDRTGLRLGKGRGVYDRRIAAMRARALDPRLVGVAFSVQEVPSIPGEGHDVRLDWIVTETETLAFSQGR